MSTERLKVLEMLNAGTITIEQANALIDALGETALNEQPVADGQTVRIERAEPTAQDFGGFTFEQVIEMGAVGVNPEFIQEMQAMGFELSFGQMVEMAAVGVRPEFIQQVRELGLDLSVEQMVEMAAVGVNPEFIQQVRAMGLNLSFEQMVEMAAVGVRPEFVAQLRKVSAATA